MARSSRGADGPLVVALGDLAALDPALVGVKAANLAVAARANLRVQPGFVLTTVGASSWSPERDAVVVALRSVWDDVSGGGRRRLVVRSSSTVEDVGTSSMAGQFRSVLGVEGWEPFLAAVTVVLASAGGVDAAEALPMAVLVQPHLDASVGGVAFGVDPVSGDTRRVVVEAVAGSPERLVSGQVSAARSVVRPSGRVVESFPVGDVALLGRADLRRIARLVRRAATVFGGPQDIEWAIDHAGALWLLQSRPITATGHTAEVAGPVLGPGPVAETFPDPLRPLEIDLWVEPMAQGIAEALSASRIVPRRRLAASPVVTTVGGRVAADLELLGYHPPDASRWRLLDPRRVLRRAGAAWRVGRIRAGLPAAAADVVASTDAWLSSVPLPTRLDDVDLLAVLERSRRTLVRLHAHEVLAGTLLDGRGASRSPRPSAAGIAVGALCVAQAARRPDDEIRFQHPEVLALLPPRLGPPDPLPRVTPAATAAAADRLPELADLPCRDALRLRARFVQELAARVSGELVRRLAAGGRLADPDLAPALHWTELVALVKGEAPPPDDLSDRLAAPSSPPLPAAFRLGPDGLAVSTARPGCRPGGGVAAGGGRRAGTVIHDPRRAGSMPGHILVVRTLDPALAAVLPGLAGLVAETGSTLSHLAILAREQEVPVVVAVHDALHRYPPGTRLLVDGGTGEVRTVGEQEPEAA